jgi:hypothetical protein
MSVNLVYGDQTNVLNAGEATISADAQKIAETHAIIRSRFPVITDPQKLSQIEAIAQDWDDDELVAVHGFQSFTALKGILKHGLLVRDIARKVAELDIVRDFVAPELTEADYQHIFDQTETPQSVARANDRLGEFQESLFEDWQSELAKPRELRNPVTIEKYSELNDRISKAEIRGVSKEEDSSARVGIYFEILTGKAFKLLSESRFSFQTFSRSRSYFLIAMKYESIQLRPGDHFTEGWKWGKVHEDRSKVYKGADDKEFREFVERKVPHCGFWEEENYSELFLDRSRYSFKPEDIKAIYLPQAGFAGKMVEVVNEAGLNHLLRMYPC